MRLVSVRVVVLAAALSVSAIPALAQDGSHAVSFDSTGFTFDRSLGSSVDIATVPALDPDSQGIDFPDPRHTTFTLFGPRAEGKRPPQVGNANGVVKVYRVADLAGYEVQQQRAEDLRTLLAERPDLTTYETVNGDDGVTPLPLLGLYGAGVVLQARAEYIDAPGVSGVAYVAAFAQDVSPLDPGSFWYVFQGLSPDGETYVSVAWALTTDLFPTSPNLTSKEYDRFVKGYAAYVTRSIEKLNGATPSDFTPDLALLDALVRSIALPGSVAASPSPAVPSASPVATVPSATPVASPSASVVPVVSPSPEVVPSASAAG
jgi:hypothetical protein